jgi:hypothetical protein
LSICFAIISVGGVSVEKVVSAAFGIISVADIIGAIDRRIIILIIVIKDIKGDGLLIHQRLSPHFMKDSSM